MVDRFTMKEAADQIGVTKNTLFRWEKNGRCPLPSRDRNNHRVYTQELIDLIKEWKDKITEPEQVTE